MRSLTGCSYLKFDKTVGMLVEAMSSICTFGFDDFFSLTSNFIAPLVLSMLSFEDMDLYDGDYCCFHRM